MLPSPPARFNLLVVLNLAILDPGILDVPGLRSGPPVLLLAPLERRGAVLLHAQQRGLRVRAHLGVKRIDPGLRLAHRLLVPHVELVLLGHGEVLVPLV